MRKLLRFALQHTRTMASFAQVLNPMTGHNSWQERGDDYDYHQEVANAGFGDMLHDWERNQKYYAALRKTISAMREAGKEVHVLDIGTGTGILAMMALRAGADTVTACEAFLPMANCAERILAANDAAQVRLIRKRSTDIQIGVDMPQKANLLVAELLDTELIGEGAIGIYNHAHEQLLTDDALCIPSRATCYAQVVQSTLATQWNSLKILANLDGDVLLSPPAQLSQCSGEAALHDVQLSQVPINSFRALTDPVKIFEFDFQRKQPREQQRENVLQMKLTASGTAELVFYWWDIDMEDAGDLKLSCAPYWAHPELAELQATCKHKNRPVANIVPWRDHWMQAIYYIPKPLQMHDLNEPFWLRCYHDEYSLWFDAHKDQQPPAQSAPRHSCSCDLHMTYTRSRIGQLNQATRNKRYLNYLEDAVVEGGSTHMLVLGDGCMLGLACAALGAASVRCLEPHRFSRRLLESITKHNQLKNVTFLESLKQLENSELASITHIFAEPYFLNSILPWDNFYFGTLLLQLQSRLTDKVKISPCAARIYALPVEFLDLHKIRAPIVNCEGFDLKLFDQMVKRSAEEALSLVEAQPLWEYPCRALSDPQEVLSVDFGRFDQEQQREGRLKLTIPGVCNGIALWVDWQITESGSPKSIVSTGPLESVEPGQFVKWDMFVRQGVHFTNHTEAITAGETCLDWSTTFKPTLGELNFNFSLSKDHNKKE